MSIIISNIFATGRTIWNIGPPAPADDTFVSNNLAYVLTIVLAGPENVFVSTDETFPLFIELQGSPTTFINENQTQELTIQLNDGLVTTFTSTAEADVLTIELI
jgi:hypothetical protein